MAIWSSPKVAERRVEELVAGEVALFNNFNTLACGDAAGAPDGWLLSRR